MTVTEKLYWNNQDYSMIENCVHHEGNMNYRDTIGSLLCAFLLLIAAAIVNHLNLWSLLGNYTVP
jgi:hypothetical protein